ncbi:tautomerase family protein [Sphingomonas sp. 2R-10]|uniref:tautomerase family protein n=1 Tax=Sphingomonas sp. 2R-10 TaxID=3045148 RepID=UPI000F767A26|nr:tautomerase family protein [Sphingomonas sp. 2R-10]MDJ0276233.1 tautomerase family protein [Sphingomonas sp. 2R-10]
MPHVLVSVVAGYSLAARQALAARIVAAGTDTLDSEVDALSVAIRDVPASDWMTAVYAPEIAPHEDLLLKRLGYGPLTPQS